MTLQGMSREDLKIQIDLLDSFADWLEQFKEETRHYHSAFSVHVQYEQLKRQTGRADSGFHQEFLAFSYHESTLIACHRDIESMEEQFREVLKSRQTRYHVLMNGRPLRAYGDKALKAAANVVDHLEKAMRSRSFRVGHSRGLLSNLLVELNNWQSQARDTQRANESAMRGLSD
jgi:hypothetical protein